MAAKQDAGPLTMPKARAKAKAPTKSRAKATRKAPVRKAGKKTPTRKRATTSKESRASEPDRLNDLWQGAVDAVHRAQTSAEQQLRQAMKQNRFHTREIRDGVTNLRKRFEQDWARLSRDLEGQMNSFEARVARERDAAGRAVDDGIRNALAAVNIPSRREIADLTRKVDKLSKKIDSLRG